MSSKEYWNENWDDPWQNLLYYMELRNMSFQQLAEKSGVKQATIEGWRRDSKMMLRAKAEYVVKVCDALNVRPSYMLGFDSDPKRANEEQQQLGISPEARMLRVVYGQDVSTQEEHPPRIKRKKRVENKQSKKDNKDRR